jgi:hypothetical protein
MKKLITVFAIAGMVLALAPAAQAQQEIDITGLGNSITDGDSTPSLTDDTDFGFTWIHGGDIFKTFTVTNTGDAVLTLSNPASITGAGAAQFLVDPLTSTSLNAGEAATFTVIYMESYTVGVHFATVTLVNDDSNEATYEFDIKAETGLMPDIDITGNGNSITNGDTTPSTNDYTDFGSVVIGTEAVKTYTVKNTSLGDLLLSPPTLTGTGTNQFTVGALTSTNVTAGQTATFTVTYTTAVARAVHTATVTLVNNDPDEESTYNFKIKAKSLNPGPIVIPPDGTTSYRIIFCTDYDPGRAPPTPLDWAVRYPTSKDIEFYNTYITRWATNEPALAGLLTTWKCIGSTTSVSARVNTSTYIPSDGAYNAAADVPIYTTDGNLFATDNADLWDGSDIPQAVRRVDGQEVLWWGGNAWTGTKKNGNSCDGPSPHGSHALGEWTSSPTRYIGAASLSVTSYQWIEGGNSHDATPGQFYGLSDPIIGKPTPGTLMFGN